ncbi:hypothetical protein ECTW15901_2318, partial [Escherichia coli TW15901]
MPAFLADVSASGNKQFLFIVFFAIAIRHIVFTSSQIR